LKIQVILVIGRTKNAMVRELKPGSMGGVISEDGAMILPMAKARSIMRMEIGMTVNGLKDRQVDRGSMLLSRGLYTLESG